jgi:hypothetical protein
LAGLLLAAANPLDAEHPAAPQGATQQTAAQPGRRADPPAPDCESSTQGSPYIPVDSWVYPAVLRLYSMGYVDTVYLGMRPWTRASLSHMLEETAAAIEDASLYADPTVDDAQGIYDALARELDYDTQSSCLRQDGHTHFESVYSTARGISGTPLRDSYHLGSTVVNDYGRPFENGFNSYSGASGYASAGRFVLYIRGEFQSAPSATGYSTALAQTLSNLDSITFLNSATGVPYNQATIPLGPIGTTTTVRLLEAYVSAQLLNHTISFGKHDEWLGPGQGGSMAYSNNADNIYAFRIDRIEPLYVPLLSRITGPFRYEFLVGPLQGHTYIPPTSTSWVNPGGPWVHVEKISFRPTQNLEFGFERTVIWGGEGHEGINLHSFLRSFLSLSAPSPAVKNSNADPGARFGAFDFSYRLPLARNWLTLYADSEVHDDVSPIDAPRRAAIRPGLYLSHVPGLHKLDIRVEAVSTDPPSQPPINGGQFMYYEGIQRQGYTNKGVLFGDWIGREDKGGQGWITYHLSGNEWIQIGLRNQKAAKDFIPGGTTLNEVDLQVVKRIGREFELTGNFAYQHWKAPIYLPGQQTVTATTFRFTWFPERKIGF